MLFSPGAKVSHPNVASLFFFSFGIFTNDFYVACGQQGFRRGLYTSFVTKQPGHKGMRSPRNT